MEMLSCCLMALLSTPHGDGAGGLFFFQLYMPLPFLTHRDELVGTMRCKLCEGGGLAVE